MPTLLNPASTAAFDPARNLIILALRDGRESALVELDPGEAPRLITALMNARCASKASSPPAPAPLAPRLNPRSGVCVVGTRGPKGGRVRRS